MLNGTCLTSFTSIACQNVATSLSLTSLVVNTVYYVRIYVTGSTTSGGNPNKRGFNICIQSSPNDYCGSAITLSDGTTNSLGSVWTATASSGIPTGCATGNPDDDVWYSFTPGGTSLTVALSAIGSNLSTSGAMIQLFSGTCGSLTSVTCGNTSITTNVTSGITYYIRVYSAGTGSIGGTSTGSAFSITATATTPPAPPANDDCSGAVTLTSGTTNNTGTVWSATSSSTIPVDCATGDPDDDVWYKITASSTNLSITLSSIGSNLITSGTRLQLFSGACGSLTSVACGTTNITAVISSGSIYYIRVYSAGTGSIGGTSTGSAFSITATVSTPTTVTAGRMKEVYQQNILSSANVLADPWEITYGPDNYLWLTEAKGYKVYRMNPNTGAKTTVLDISQGASGYLTAGEHTSFNVQFSSTQNPWPQGGMAGLAIHPKFLDVTAPKNYVYISYVHTYNGGSSPTGIFFTNSVVRFTYNTSTGKLESPVAICDTLPGSSDHNSQRMIIAPVGGTNYLFYASGDMGSGQFGNRDRPIKSQNPASYEGKILRFNLEQVAGSWIPSDNPYSATSAVYSIGIRNNQGFAYDTSLNIMYGSSHGPYSDDEINIIESFKNYGHPLVIGFAADGNYNGTTTASTNTSISAGAPFTDNSGNSSCAPIGNEATNKIAIDASGNGLYKDPLFSAYAASNATIANIWRNNTGNGTWPSEGWSGLDLYTHTIIPGWHKSLIAASLKWGRLVRLRLSSSGIATAPANAASDTISYFGSTNRFRDIAFGPNGKDIYVIMDRSSTTSGPSAGSPIIPACGGCVQKYTFLGYADASGASTIPNTIPVTVGTVNSTTSNAGTTIVIDATNNNLWVPITGPDGNIMAEIYANGNNLDTVTSAFYQNSGAIRIRNGVRYLDRNIRITPKNQPGPGGVKIRLYISKAEYDALDADAFSGVSTISDLKILKNNDVISSTIQSATTLITPGSATAFGTNNGYVLQADITGFSSFYFASSNITLPLDLLTFKGNLINNNATLLQWQTANEINASYFTVERSTDANVFSSIGQVSAHGNNYSTTQYSFTDNNIINVSSPVIYYRLKMIDTDGTFKYSGIVSITLTYITGKVTLAPNPVVNDVKVTISAPEDGKIQWKLVDNTGRVIMQNTMHVKKGNGNNLIINMDKLAKGSYYLSVFGAGIDQKLKLQKL